MASTSSNEEYWTVKGRVSSFQTVAARRASTARGKATKGIKWPHKFLKVEELSEAGFYFNPLPKQTDNVTCFLCQKSIVGWEKDDDPLAEHLKLSPDCGWALVVSIQKRNEELANEDPASERMIEARKATFGDRWPYENMKGWKCKTKALVDAGWIYAPTPESDDWVTCAYCDLGLDGWEPSDDPMEQHFKRNPECSFFAMISASSNKAANKKKAAKGRKPRASKASRLSTQSNITLDNTDTPSFVDLPAEEDDSILTTATVTSQGGRKMPKPATKKASGRKTKAKKEGPTETPIAAEPEDDDFEVKVPPKTKAGRSKKRTSEAMDGSILAASEAPAPKRRATRSRTSMAVLENVADASSLAADDSTMTTIADESVQPLPKKRGRTSKVVRKVSTASKVPLRMPSQDDDELDAALMADLEKQLVNDQDSDQQENTTQALDHHISSSPTASHASMRKTVEGDMSNKAQHTMFNHEAMEIDDAEIDAELAAMQAEESKPLPKTKGGKAKITRKPSVKQAAVVKKLAVEEPEESTELEEFRDQRASEAQNSSGAATEQSSSTAQKKKPAKKALKRGKTASVASEIVPDISSISVVETTAIGCVDFGNESDASMISQSTVVRGGSRPRTSNLNGKAKGGKKAASKNVEVIVRKPASKPEPIMGAETIPEGGVTHERVEPAPILPPTKSGAQPSKMAETNQSILAEAEPCDQSSMSIGSTQEKLKKPKAAKGKGKVKAPAKTAKPREQEVPEEQIAAASSRSTTPPPKEATPSVSPQSSDAENQPPSTKISKAPATTKATIRIPLAVSTPTKSPSKRNIIAGLETTKQWTAVDLEEIFTISPNKENGSLFGDAIAKAKMGILSSEEKGMTVEEWIHFNAKLAEARLKEDCERMVGLFEREGGKAMIVLEEVKIME